MRQVRRLVLATIVLGLAQGARAQAPPGPPPAPKNLKVLPKDMTREQLIPLMRGIARSLGVKCDHCHAAGADPHGPPDFPSDAKWEKRTARDMMRMTAAINDDFIAKLEARPAGDPVAGLPAVRVECVTCHRGLPRPETLQTRVSRVLAKDGADAAVKEYRDLRGQYLTSGSYDFGDQPLNAVAEKLVAEGKAAQALPLLELNVEYNPKSGAAYGLLAEARLAGGNRAGAIEALEKAVALDPENPRPKKRLEELKAPPKS